MCTVERAENLPLNANKRCSGSYSHEAICARFGGSIRLKKVNEEQLGRKVLVNGLPQPGERPRADSEPRIDRPRSGSLSCLDGERERAASLPPDEVYASENETTYQSTDNDVDESSVDSCSISSQSLGKPSLSNGQVMFLACMLDEHGAEILAHPEGAGVGFVQRLVAMGACGSSALFGYTDSASNNPPPKHNGKLGSVQETSQKKNDLMRLTGMRSSLSMDDLATFTKQKQKPVRTNTSVPLQPDKEIKRVSNPVYGQSVHLSNPLYSPGKVTRANKAPQCFKPRTASSVIVAPKQQLKLPEPKERTSFFGGKLSPRGEIKREEPLKKLLCIDESQLPSTTDNSKPQAVVNKERAEQFVSWTICKLSVGKCIKGGKFKGKGMGGKECVDALLNIYSTVTTQSCILGTLLQMWRAHPREGDLNDEFHRQCVYQILKRWIKKSFHTLSKNTLSDLADFIDEETKKTSNDLIHALRQLLISCHAAYTLRSKFEPINILEVLPGMFTEDKANIVKQMMWIEGRIFAEIPVQGILELGTREPMVNRLIEQFNQVSFTVAREIVGTEKTKQRISVLKKMIAIAQACRQAQNFNTLMEILAGLNMSCVQRLKKTWDSLPDKYIQIHNDLEDLMDHHHNYSNYRKELANCTGVILPYLGIVLRDITFTEISTSFITNNIIDFERITMVATIIRRFQSFQQSLKSMLDTPCPVVKSPPGPSSSVHRGIPTSVSQEDLADPHFEDLLRKMSFRCEPSLLTSTVVDVDVI